MCVDNAVYILQVQMTTNDKSAAVKVLNAMMEEPTIPVSMIIQYCK